MTRTFGLIPAAGKSRRMGRAKLLLPCGGQTVLERVIAALREARVDEVVVVVPPEADELANVALGAGAHVVRLAEETPDMRATCQAGLRWLAARYQPRADERWLLLPADHPTVRAEIVSALLAARETHPAMDIVVPTYQGRRGHPTLLGWRHVAGMLAVPEGEGLNTYIRSQAATTLELPWANDEVVRDLDTPEDYVRLQGEIE